MAQVDGITLMMAVQAVHAEIKRYELLLTSETLRDPEEIQSLILSYEKALSRLRAAYESECASASNLPPYSKLVSG
jgi:hypothetical protein